MNKRIACLVVFTLATFQAHADFTGKVISIADGDTITVLTANNNQKRIRLSSIDAPEKNQPFGTKAKDFTGSLIHGKQVYIKEDGTDQYNRVLGTVFLGNQNINKTIVHNGYAWAYRRYVKDSSYISLEMDAKRHQRGLWSDKNAIEPELWRRQQKNRWIVLVVN